MSEQIVKTYYLVSPGESAGEKKRPFYWSLDNGDKWIGVARGIWRPKSEFDIIKGAQDAGDLTELDWTKTPFRDDRLLSGWLCRCGKFFGCPVCFHDVIAAIVLGMKVAELEKKGWARVLDSRRFVCDHRLSAEQRNWLSLNGFKIPDCY